LVEYCLANCRSLPWAKAIDPQRSPQRVPQREHDGRSFGNADEWSWYGKVGAFFTELIFQIPGIGTLIYQAINARQIVELQSYIAIIAIGYVLINFTIDALYVVLDPRIRRAHA